MGFRTKNPRLFSHINDNFYVYIAGWKEISLVDVLESVSFTLWTSYCNFNCPWCGNYRIAKGIDKRKVSTAEILKALERNSDFIDYFHVTGGEPTLQSKPLTYMFKKVKEYMSLKTSLDTNGSNPLILKSMLFYIDHVAIDIKAPLNNPLKYARATGLTLKLAKFFLPRIIESIKIASEAPFVELRTTMVPGIINSRDVIDVVKNLKHIIKKFENRMVFVVQQFIPYETIYVEEFKLKKRVDPEIVKSTAEKVAELVPFEVYYRTLEDGTGKIS